MAAMLIAWSLAWAGGRVEADGPPEAGRLGATANGQTVCRIDARRRLIQGFDVARPATGRDLVGPADASAPDFVAVGCLPGDVVAAVCRSGEEWSLRTYRTQPDGPVDATRPLQETLIGRSAGPAAEVDLAVSHVRGWLAVTGLPPPLPPVVRAAVAGVRVGPLSDRACPVLPDGLRPVAAAVSPLDELVLILRAGGRSAGGDPAGDQLAYYDLAGRELLRVDSGLRDTTGLDFSRADGTLWATGSEAGGRRGLWRLDAAVAAARQVVRPVLAAAFDRPLDVVCPSPRAIIVLHGETVGSIASIDPVAAASGGRP